MNTASPILKTPLKVVSLDEGSSFKLLHHRVKAENFPWDYHCHLELELVFVSSGRGRRHVGNHISYYQDGDLVLIGSELPHAGFGYGSKGVHEEFVVQFKQETFDLQHSPEIQDFHPLFERAKQGICFYGRTKRAVGEKIKLLPELSAFERFLTMMEVLQILASSTEFIVLNEGKSAHYFSTKDQSRLKKIYDHLEQNYQKAIDIGEVAALVNLSVPAFCNYFKRLFGVTYTDFVNDYRVRRACQMLVSDRSIFDISFECGFSSQSYFSKVFKKVKGTTPMEFRHSLVMRRT